MTTKRTLWIALAIAALSFCGLALVAGEGTRFPHTPHLEEGAECATCHLAEEGMKLNGEACADCHDEEVPEFVSAKSRRAPIAFPHDAHGDLDCTDCHGKTAKDEQKSNDLLMTQTRCIACHKENGVELSQDNCAACHGSDARKMPPADHNTLWSVRHGKESRWRVFEEHGKECGLCHSNDSCETCHKTRRPKDHTGLWRMRTHGRAAGWDRDRCKTCHEPGLCTQCHATTSPINHTASWEKTHGLATRTAGTESCNVCHTYTNPCISCHVSK
jgi:hypothetical protein